MYSFIINTINILSIYSFRQYPMQKQTLRFSLLHQTSSEDLAAPSPISHWAWTPRRGGSEVTEVSNPITTEMKPALGQPRRKVW